VPSNDAVLATRLLEGLERARIDYAVLHREEDVARGCVDSDVDVIVDRPVPRVLCTLLSHLSPDVVLLMTWRYDVTSWSSFWARAGLADGGVQLDLSYDPEGWGRYGLRTTQMLARSEVGIRFRRLSPPAELLYLALKRSLKGELAQLHVVLANAAYDVPQARALLGEFVAGRRARWARAALDGSILSSRGLRFQLLGHRQALRYVRRILKPEGFVLAVPDCGALIAELTERLTPPLIGLRRLDKPAGPRRRVLQWADRRRPLVMLAQRSAGGSRPRPDLDWSRGVPSDPYGVLGRALEQHALDLLRTG
jgi:hypothetical protein